MRSFFFVSAILLSISFRGACQSPVDSIKNRLSVARADTLKIKLYHALALLLTDERPEEALAYENQALRLAHTMNDAGKIAAAYTDIGIIHRKHSEYGKALSYYNKALLTASTLPPSLLTNTYLEMGIAYLRLGTLDSAKIFITKGLQANQQSPDLRLEAQLYNMMGNIVKDDHDYAQALEHYIRSAAFSERLQDDDGLTQSVSNIGNMHYLMGNYEKAEEYAIQSLHIAEKIQKKSSIAYAHRLMGRIYRQLKKYDAALQAYRNAIVIYQALGAKRDIGETHFNAGNIYYEKGDFRKALNQYLSAIAVERTVQDSVNMAYAFEAIGLTYQELKDKKNALTYLDTAQRYARQKKLMDLTIYINDDLSTMYASNGDYRRAYEYHIKFMDLRDSLEGIQRQEEARDLAAKYEHDKKENEIRALNAENRTTELELKQSRLERTYLIVFAVLVLVLMGVVYNRYIIKSRTSRKLKALDEMKSRFFANLSHEFRTPLSLIAIPLQKRMEEAGTAEEKADLDVMHRNTRRLQILINQLLDLSKIEAGKMPLAVREEDIAALIFIVHDSFVPLASQKQIDFQLLLSQQPLYGSIDRDKLEKILFNLLSNAFKFTPEGGRITVQASQQDARVLISVRDNGVGIPADKLGRVFERFYQADDSSTRTNEGSGIGLALAKELAELHHGKLTVQSEEGNGSEFTLSIPLKSARYKTDRVEVPDDIHQSEETGFPVLSSAGYENLPAGVSSSIDQPWALVVEDHPDMRVLIGQVLQKDYQVITAANGLEAYDLSVSRVPDIIVCDIMMPGMDGIALCEKLKEHPATSHIPVILLTARADRESRLEGLQTGADDYLTKPFDPKELLVRVTNLITQRKKLQEIYRQEVILQPGKVEASQPENIFIRKVMDVLEGYHASPEFGLDEFCREVGMSKMQLHRKLKALTDKSPGEFLREFRLERARQLLAIKGAVVSEVAYQVGYNNLSHFTKMFKEFTGFTPSEYHQRIPALPEEKL